MVLSYLYPYVGRLETSILAVDINTTNRRRGIRLPFGDGSGQDKVLFL